MRKATVILLLVSAATVAGAQDVKAPALDDHAPLGNFVGRWTTAGNEETFVETCDLYAGRFHVVCHSRRTRPDGSTGQGMSILGYLPDQGYVYTGNGSKGRYETLQGGTWSQGSFVFTSTASEDGKRVATRIRIGPFAEQGFRFVVDTSTDGGAWTGADTTTYVRLD